MGYLLQENIANEIISKYKNSYIAKEIGISPTYVSIIFHRKRAIPKRVAYAFCKVINSEYEIEDLFERAN